MRNSLLIIVFCMLQVNIMAQADLTVEITGLKVLKGELYVSLYNKESTYMKPEQAFGKVSVPANQELVKVKLKDVPKGDYALAVFQDMNANAILDVNDMKIPKESFGFSNNP